MKYAQLIHLMCVISDSTVEFHLILGTGPHILGSRLVHFLGTG